MYCIRVWSTIHIHSFWKRSSEPSIKVQNLKNIAKKYKKNMKKNLILLQRHHYYLYKHSKDVVAVDVIACCKFCVFFFSQYSKDWHSFGKQYLSKRSIWETLLTSMIFRFLKLIWYHTLNHLSFIFWDQTQVNPGQILYFTIPFPIHHI